MSDPTMLAAMTGRTIKSRQHSASDATFCFSHMYLSHVTFVVIFISCIWDVLRSMRRVSVCVVRAGQERHSASGSEDA